MEAGGFVANSTVSMESTQGVDGVRSDLERRTSDWAIPERALCPWNSHHRWQDPGSGNGAAREMRLASGSMATAAGPPSTPPSRTICKRQQRVRLSGSLRLISTKCGKPPASSWRFLSSTSHSTSLVKKLALISPEQN